MTLRMSIFTAFTAVILACVYFIGGGAELSAREQGLVGLLLTIVSILASWFVSYHYSESQHSKALKEVQEFHSKNLKTYAIKASEKVNNLSNELSKLSAYLDKELTRTDYDNTEQELNAKEERIESAIHLINTLKSINDNALSDWEGVIGDVLEQRREEQREQEEDLAEVITRYESVVTNLETEMHNRGENAQILQNQIEGLKNEIRVLATRIGITSPTLLFPPRSKKTTVEANCPSCGTLLKYRQRPKEKGLKGIKCTTCDTKLVSRYSKTSGFTLEVRFPVKEKMPCPHCTALIEFELDQIPTSSANIECVNCGAQIRVVRIAEGFRVKKIQSAMDVEEVNTKLDIELIEKVKAELPLQPWPKGVHREIAQKLGVSSSIVSSIIFGLIREGIYKPQINGVLFAPENLSSSEKVKP